MSFLNQIKANKPTASLEGYFISMLAKSKFGKTTFAVDLAKEFYGDLGSTLLLATEIGYKTMDGVFAIPITGFDYAETDDGQQKGFIETVDELVENKEDIPFRFIIIDTITALERYAISYAIRKKNREDNPKTRYTDISDVPWGAGYTATAELVYHQIDRLKKAGYGVFVIGHEKTKKITNKEGFEYDFTTFNVLGKTSDIIEREADMIIYGDLQVRKGEDGEAYTERKLKFRSDGSILCGTRFRNFPEAIDSDAKEFLKTFQEAILGLYNGDEKAVKKAQKEQAKEAEIKAETAKENEKEEKQEEKAVETLIAEITETIGGFEKADKVSAAKGFKEVLGFMDYTKSEDAELLKQCLAHAKSVKKA